MQCDITQCKCVISAAGSDTLSIVHIRPLNTGKRVNVFFLSNSPGFSRLNPATLVAGLLSRGQGPEGPATGHLDTGFFLVSLCL